MKTPLLKSTLSLTAALASLLVGCTNNRSSVLAGEEGVTNETSASVSSEVFFGFVKQSGSDNIPSILVLTKPDLNNLESDYAITLGGRSGVYVLQSSDQELLKQMRRIANLSFAETQIVFAGKLDQQDGMTLKVEIEKFAECGKEINCRAGVKLLLSKKDEPKAPVLIATGKDIKFREIQINRMGGRQAQTGLFFADSAEKWAKVYEHRLNDILPLKMPTFDIDFSKEMVVGYQTGGKGPEVTAIKIDKERKAIFVLMDQEVASDDDECFYAGGVNEFSSTAVVIDKSDFEGVELGAPIFRKIKVKC